MYFNLKWSYWGLLDRAESREIWLPKQKKKTIRKRVWNWKIIIYILVLLNNIYINLHSREPSQKGWLIFSWFQFAFFAFYWPYRRICRLENQHFFYAGFLNGFHSNINLFSSSRWRRIEKFSTFNRVHIVSSFYVGRWVCFNQQLFSQTLRDGFVRDLTEQATTIQCNFTKSCV